MLRALLIASIFIPSLVFAATFNVQKEIAITEPVKDNAYLVGLDVAVSNTTGADVGVIAG